MTAQGTSSRPVHPIQVVARRTGLTPDVIRVWERRYRAVAPSRSESNRRLYSDADVHRLRLLRRATLAGRRIGDVASLPLPVLQDLVSEDEGEAAAGIAGMPVPEPPVRPADPAPHRAACVEAVERLDADGLLHALATAAVSVSPTALTEQIILPLLREIGERWRSGEMRVAHEHLTSAIVRSFLGGMRNGRATDASRPDIVVTTPAGQRHELGALVAGVTAAMQGWRVTYLGPNLPATEIAAAATVRRARAVALSVVHPPDDPLLADELRELRRLLPDAAKIIVGGASAAAYSDVLAELDALQLDDMSALRNELENLRTGAA